MIAHLTGKLIHKSPTYVVIDVGGVGYDVKVSLNTFSKIKALEVCHVLIHQYIKGDTHTLYGFADMEEKHWFLHLIHVNSVGPRTTMTILSSLSPVELEQVIIGNQTNVLKRIKGIGDKAAQRIILELKGKMAHHSSADGTSLTRRGTIDTMGKEALAALVRLGINKTIAEKTITEVRSKDPALSLESLIKRALQVS